MLGKGALHSEQMTDTMLMAVGEKKGILAK